MLLWGMNDHCANNVRARALAGQGSVFRAPQNVQGRLFHRPRGVRRAPQSPRKNAEFARNDYTMYEMNEK